MSQNPSRLTSRVGRSVLVVFAAVLLLCSGTVAASALDTISGDGSEAPSGQAPAGESAGVSPPSEAAPSDTTSGTSAGTIPVPDAPSYAFAGAASAGPAGDGYWVTTDGGEVTSVREASDDPLPPNYGGICPSCMLNAPIVGIAGQPGGGGYWLVGGDGGVFTFGNAGFYGGMGGVTLSAPVVGMAVTANGQGYRLVGRDGAIYAFGNAGYLGRGDGLLDFRIAVVKTLHVLRTRDHSIAHADDDRLDDFSRGHEAGQEDKSGDYECFSHRSTADNRQSTAIYSFSDFGNVPL